MASSDYEMSRRNSNASVDTGLMICLNEVSDIPPQKVIHEVHKQLIDRFQPAMKNVAENGSNLLRSLQHVQKMSEAYIKSIDEFADSGNKAYAGARQRAAELKELATCMREVNRRHSESIKKFSFLITMINQYGRNEKAKLKRFHDEFKKREKAMKKTSRKNKKDSSDPLPTFYINERNLALQQQHKRYKFFIEKHTEWLRDYMTLFGALRQLFTELPVPQITDSPVEHHEGMLDDDDYEDGYIAPCEYNERNKSFRSGADIQMNHSENNHHDEAESFLNDNFTLQPALTSQPDAQSNYLLPPEEQPLASPPPPPPLPQPDQLKTPGVQMRYRDAKQQTNTVERATDTIDRSTVYTPRINAADQRAVSFRDVATTTEPYENYTREQAERMHRVKRPSSLAEDKLQTRPVTAIRRSTREETASRSMTALNETMKDDVRMNDFNNIDKEEREPNKDSEKHAVMFRPAQLNAVPTAFVQAPFLTSDYGKTLVCIHNFHGQTADQLSLRNGERVVLIKCGSKGWIFAKHIETQRTGWFPSRFVRADSTDNSSTRDDSSTDHL